ncbi:MAG TPA: diaminopimelate decarboxylase [Candidatus Limnocylindria bacterium]|nr:diaminopimelate decarboxylase [Candidatus Limnocylindria bacterium]
MTDPVAALLREAAARWGTPLYVTDLDAASARARAWADALPGASVAYAVKANPDPALLRRLAAEGHGFEVVGPVELELALRAGADPARIVVNGVGQADADLHAALATGALVNAESLGGLDALLGAPDGGRIGVRINPALEADTHDHLATGAAGSKFGIALDELPEALRRIRAADARLESIGAHIGSDIADPEPFRRLAELLVRLAREAGVEHVDLGGGWRGDPAAYASAVAPALPNDIGITVEPGRSIVAEAGWLLTRVVRVQARGHLVADAGMTELIRPMLYGAVHPVELLEPGALLPSRGPWTLAGPVCEAGDILARDVELGPAAGEGALLAIGEAGAYGLAMASSYNGRLRPAQAVIEGGEVRLSRRRETLEDLVARDL